MKSASREKIHAIIFAEGGSARLRPLTDHLPTSLLPVGGTPILDHQLQALRASGIKTITVVGGYRSAQVEQACRFYPGVQFIENAEFSRTEATLTGLRAVTLGAKSVLFLRGDLLVHRDLLSDFLDHEAEWIGLADGRGRPAGLDLISQELSECLVEAAGKVENPAHTELFSFLETALSTNDKNYLEWPRRSWTRVETMEDLAVSLRRFREAGKQGVVVPARVPETVSATETTREPVEALSEKEPVSRSLEVLEAPQAEPAPLLARPLYKTLPH